jgi:hypothetical protein
MKARADSHGWLGGHELQLRVSCEPVATQLVNMEVEEYPLLGAVT